MKKVLLSLFAFALSLGMNAQTIISPEVGTLQSCPISAQKRVASLSPQKIELASNQRLVGYYTTDELAEYGLGIPNYGSNPNARAAIELTPDVLKNYDGMKVVSIRFGLAYPLDKSRVFISRVTEAGEVGEDIVSQDVATTKKGWNQIDLTTPYVISYDDDLVIGFDFNQKSTKNGTNYTLDCFPLSVVSSGRTDLPLLLYAKIKNEEGWYNFGTSNGNLSVQLIVEGEFPDYAATPEDFGILENGINCETTFNLSFNNGSKEAIKDIDYIVSVDGVASAEQHVTLETAVEKGYDGKVKVTVPAISELGSHAVTVEITKVNGNKNLSKSRIAKGSVALVKEKYNRNLVLEEFTTEQCPQCPGGASRLSPAIEAADQSRVFAVCHHSGYYTDWLTGSWDSDITYLLFGGNGSTFAPGLMFNRNSDIWSGTGINTLGIVGSVPATEVITAMINTKLEEKANAELTMNILPNADMTQATVTVSGKCNDAYDKAASLLTFYVTENNVRAKAQSGATTNPYYHNHVIRYNNSSWGESVTWNDDNTFTTTFNVDIDALWDIDQLSFVAFLNEYSSKSYENCKIENSIGQKFSGETGINGIADDNASTEVSRCTLDGVKISAPQKGLNIVKLSDGRTVKVVVK